MAEPFPDHRTAALALLFGHHNLTWSAGQFLGGIVVDPSPLSEKQAAWLGKLLNKAGLPGLAEGGAA